MNRIVSLHLPCLIGLFVAAAPSAALAVDTEFITHGGFDPVVNAFKYTALFFSDGEYRNLVGLTAVVGLGGGVVWSYFRSNGDPSHVLKTFMLVIFSSSLYASTVFSTGNVTVYDPVSNETELVPGVPDIIVLMAGGVNAFEQAAVQIAETAAPTVSVEDVANGTIFDVIRASFTQPYAIDNQEIFEGMKEYVFECVKPSTRIASSGLSMDELKRTSGDLNVSFEKAASPALHTKDPTQTGSPSVTCKYMWDSVLEPALQNNASFSSALAGTCSAVGLDVTDAAQAARCNTYLDTIPGNYFTNSSGSADRYFHMQQVALARAMQEAILSRDPGRAGSSQLNASYIQQASGIAKSIEEYGPTIRATFLAASLSMIPLVFLFAVSPLFTKILQVTLGLFVFSALWSVIDVGLAQITNSLAIEALEEVRAVDAAYSYTSLMLTPEAATKALATFANLRIASILLAAFVSASVFALSGAPFSSISNSLSAKTEGIGAEAGVAAMDPSRQGTAATSMARGAARHANLASNPGHMDGLERSFGFDMAKSAGTGSVFSNTSEAIRSGSIHGHYTGGSNSEAARVYASEGEAIGRTTSAFRAAQERGLTNVYGTPSAAAATAEGSAEYSATAEIAGLEAKDQYGRDSGLENESNIARHEVERRRERAEEMERVADRYGVSTSDIALTRAAADIAQGSGVNYDPVQFRQDATQADINSAMKHEGQRDGQDMTDNPVGTSSYNQSLSDTVKNSRTAINSPEDAELTASASENELLAQQSIAQETQKEAERLGLSPGELVKRNAAIEAQQGFAANEATTKLAESLGIPTRDLTQVSANQARMSLAPGSVAFDALSSRVGEEGQQVLEALGEAGGGFVNVFFDGDGDPISLQAESGFGGTVNNRVTSQNGQTIDHQDHASGSQLLQLLSEPAQHAQAAALLTGASDPQLDMYAANIANHWDAIHTQSTGATDSFSKNRTDNVGVSGGLSGSVGGTAKLPLGAELSGAVSGDLRGSRNHSSTESASSYDGSQTSTNALVARELLYEAREQLEVSGIPDLASAALSPDQTSKRSDIIENLGDELNAHTKSLRVAANESQISAGTEDGNERKRTDLEAERIEKNQEQYDVRGNIGRYPIIPTL